MCRHILQQFLRNRLRLGCLRQWRTVSIIPEDPAFIFHLHHDYSVIWVDHANVAHERAKCLLVRGYDIFLIFLENADAPEFGPTSGIF